MVANIVNREQAEHQLLCLLPHRTQELARLKVLSARQAYPVITVVGKYNHGKSRLLNELIGHKVFSVADKRETIDLSEVTHQAVRWLDAPGLDADVASQDDQYAEQAIWLQSDIRLVVHAAKEGELDAAEKALIEQLLIDTETTQRQNLFVLSQIDQLNSEADIQTIIHTIGTQIPHLHFHPVSSTRHQRGLAENKALFIEKSGIPALQQAIQQALQQVHRAREHENNYLLKLLHTELTTLEQGHTAKLEQLHDQQHQQHHEFDNGLRIALDKVAAELTETVNHTGIDHALIPDNTQDILQITAGKLERSRIQVAYSRAIKHLSAHLIKHGVMSIPSEQRVVSAGLNNVMVAVLGISVKYREHLRKLFFEEAGREHLHKDFTHYYELSDKRSQLRQRISDTEAALQTTQSALTALAYLESYSCQ